MSYTESHLVMKAYEVDEKLAAEQDDLINSSDFTTAHSHFCSRSGSWKVKRSVVVKRAMIALVVSLMILLALGLVELCCPHLAPMLLKRQNGPTNGSSSGGNPFINEHLWIIIACVVGMFSCFET